MGSTHRVHSQERQNIPIWLELQQAECSNHPVPYPIPCMDECMDSIGDVTISSKFVANSRYWQVEIADEDRDKTAFGSQHGNYVSLKSPAALKIAPRTFQRSMDIPLSMVKLQLAVVYFCDIIIFYFPSLQMGISTTYHMR